MAPRGQRILVVSFGPAATLVLPTAVAFSRAHASSVDPGGPGGYRASFRLDRDSEAYGRAYGDRSEQVKVVKLEPRRPRYQLKVSGETLRRAFAERLARREDAEREK